MKRKDHYNVLAVCMLRDFTGRELFAGMLEEMSNRKNWHLDLAGPGRLFSERELANEDGEPFDGYILTMPGTDAVMKRLAAAKAPTVLVNITDRRLAARSEAVSSVWTDNEDIGRRAAKHLLDRGGYKSAGYVHELKPQFYSSERMTAFRAEMRRKGIKTSVFPEGDDFDDFQDRLREWVRKLPKPAAVMAVSDMRAADVINACKAEGILVPSQVAVVGVDNDISQHGKCRISLSSVVLNMNMMGRQAVRELDISAARASSRNFASRRSAERQSARRLKTREWKRQSGGSKAVQQPMKS